MPLPTSVIDRYHRELTDNVAKHGLDIFRMQPPMRSPQKRLRVCCGGPTKARLQGFKEMFGTDETFIHTDTLMAGNSLIGYMTAQVIVLFFESRADFNRWLADGVEADFLKLTQPVNADKLFVVRCDEPLPMQTLRDIVGSDNIQTSLDVAQATRAHGVSVESDSYIDAMVMIPSGTFLYGEVKSYTLPDDARGLFVANRHIIGDCGQVGGAVFYDCYPEIRGALNIGTLANMTTVAQPLLIAQSQVTQALYKAVTNKTPSWFKGAERPVEQVSWFDMLELANVMSGADACYTNIGSGLKGSVDWIEGCLGFRLPTQREWEYAYRAFSPYTYSGSDSPEDVAWHNSNAKDQTHPVGQLKLNALGAYDMMGNVFEWCWDIWDPKHDPRIVRGGAWLFGADLGHAAARLIKPVTRRDETLGGRLTRSIA
jgi:formylglycine-generating enzyme